MPKDFTTFYITKFYAPIRGTRIPPETEKVTVRYEDYPSYNSLPDAAKSPKTKLEYEVYWRKRRETRSHTE